MIEYLRLQEPEARGTIGITPGGSLDVVVDSEGPYGAGKLVYSPGLKAFRKTLKETIVYRFTVPNDARKGISYEVKGNAGSRFWITVT